MDAKQTAEKEWHVRAVNTAADIIGNSKHWYYSRGISDFKLALKAEIEKMKEGDNGVPKS